tara:strand:+ start:54 stop:767 length:714 start_codon:yes stop_codon:yes gene_type:complete
MKFIRLFTITFFIIFSSLTSIVYAASLKFDSSTYEGEVKNGKAHGVGIFTFSDGSTYEGKVSKNRIHRKGIYTDAQGRVFEGKFRYGKITNTIDMKNREVIKLNPLTGVLNYFETKGSGNTANMWFESTPKTISTKKKILPIKELDIFDKPDVFSSDYGDEEKLKEILSLKNLNISIENARIAGDKKNQKIVYEYTSKGQNDLKAAEASIGGNKEDSGSGQSDNSDNSGSEASGGFC